MGIKDILEEPLLYEQLAEEAVELAHAALKYARILRGRNPTPITNEEGFLKLIEEYSDVIQCARLVAIPIDEGQIARKAQRWIERLEELEHE